MCFALGHLLGVPGCGPLADHGLAALRDTFEDREHGGWFPEAGGPANTPRRPTARVRAAGRRPARRSRAAPRPVRCSSGPRASSSAASGPRTRARASSRGIASGASAEDYRGANANMHTVEAFLAARDATGDALWSERALRIAERLVRDVAGAHDWRVVEHFDAGWTPLPEYNRDEVRHPVPALRGDARPRPRVGAPAPSPAAALDDPPELARPGLAVALRPCGRRRLGTAAASCTRPTSTAGRW